MVKDNKKVIIFSIIGVAVFIALVVSTSYAFFTNTINKNGDDDAASITTKKIEVNFTDGPELNFDTMIPGDTFTKTFTLENKSNVPVKFKIFVKDVRNTFIEEGEEGNKKIPIQVVVKEGEKIKKTTVFPKGTAPISDDLTIAANTTVSYSVEITYEDTPNNSLDNIDKEIRGKIFIEEV